MLKKTITKNIIRVFALIIVLSLTLVSVSGCVFVQENKERVYNQEIIEINGANGIKMTLTQNELIDYYNSYAYYMINYYGYSVEETLDFVVESKIKSKYLLTIAMGELTKNYPERIPVLQGKGSLDKVEGALTYAEYFSAIKSVNDSMESSLETLIKKEYQTTLNSQVTRISKENVERIEFTPETLEYLKEEYLVKEDIDTDRIKFRVVYKIDGEESFSEEYIVPNSMYTTPFTSEEEGSDLSLEINFEERIASDGKGSGASYKTHQAVWEYKVISPRATKTAKEEVVDDEITIGDIKVNRYDTLETLEQKGAVVEKLDIAAEYERLRKDPTADSQLRDAYRQLSNNLAAGYKTMDYIYNSAFESAVISALQYEIEKTATKDKTDWDAEILKEYRFLYQTSKDSYSGDNAKAFADNIKSNLDNYYYHPQVDNISDYIYVYQILFNFNEEQKAFLESVINEADGNEELNQKHYEAMKELITTKESNPSYDPDYDCPLHEINEVDATCKWEAENPDSDKVCPSIAYIRDEVNFMEVYNELQAKLLDPANTNQRFDIFEDYMYRYNDDPGVMNSPTGYMIAPKGVDDPNGFYQSFLDLAHDVYDYSKEVGNAFTSEGKLGYAFTPYGVHIIMTSLRPFAGDSGEELSFDSDAEMLEYIKNTKINLSGDTIYSVLKEKVIADAKSLAYSQFTNTNIDSDIKDNKSIVTINQKKLDKLFENYQG